ncbi:transcription initiation factor IIB family protein [Halomarina halobia]|uniref:Transcription initiation factor IIB n=1 Tax=Halomarina halobia TaxID=3033386 RepID=A0ABD6ADE4_9EURY|nr:transcription initiation factor IIB [Halomarina sp. PSR21]
MSERVNRTRGVRRRDRTAETDAPAERAESACPECGGDVVSDAERAERLCAGCGLIVEGERIDRGPEWRAFDAEEREDRSRVGAPTTNMLHDRGLSTTIDWQDRDAYGKLIGPRRRARMQRLRVWDERFRAKNGRERNLKQALGEIDRMASALGLPENVRETAGVLYRRALEAGLLPGRSIEGMATACLYGAARQAGVPRSLGEVSDVSRVAELDVQRTYRYLSRELGLGIVPTDPTTYVPRFVSALELGEEVARVALDLLETAKSRRVHSGKSPVGLAAAAVYAAAYLANESVTQAAVSDVAGVSEVTIRNRYQELLDAQADR